MTPRYQDAEELKALMAAEEHEVRALRIAALEAELLDNDDEEETREEFCDECCGVNCHARWCGRHYDNVN